MLASHSEVADRHFAARPKRAMFRKLIDRFRSGDGSAGASYRAYTTAFDQIIESENLHSLLGSQKFTTETDLAAEWRSIELSLLPWKTSLLVKAAKIDSEIRTKLTPHDRQQIAVAFLIDQSGSMKGQKMLFTAAAIDVAQELLSTLGAAVEVLGFTTAHWKGGQSRQLWIKNGRPKLPGRLNDLLHIAYRDAKDTRTSSLGVVPMLTMLRPDILKENIDGEAIEWAYSRLRKLREARKFLVVLSDGAPVDDSTLNENAASYLFDHLKRVVANIAANRDVCLAGVGVGHDVGSVYQISGFAESPTDLGDVVLDLVNSMLTSSA